MVTEQEIDALLRANGWYLYLSKSYKTRYGYAKGLGEFRGQTRYLGSERKFPAFTPGYVLKRIGKASS